MNEENDIPIATIESGPGTETVANTAHNDVTICQAFWHADRECRVVRFRSLVGAWYCGYIRTDLSSETTYDDLFDDIDAHGGLTYGVDGEGWIGFDTHHAFDVSLDANGEELIGTDDEYAGLLSGPSASGLPFREWTQLAVAAEYERIAEQLGGNGS